MKDIDAFLTLFGKITVGQVVSFALALGFLFAVYRKVREYLIKRYEAEKKRDEQLQEALDGVHKYPEYRQQSIEIQKMLEEQMEMIREALEDHTKRLAKMEEDSNRRDRNKLRDILLQNYRYYTNKERNPSQTWSRMESEAFWELFKDYERAGGNGYMHSDVLPAMERLTVVDVNEY